MRKNPDKKISEQNDAFSLSISDLMAGLLAVFILALSYFMLNLGQVTEQFTGNSEKRSALLQEIQKKAEAQGVKITIDKKQGVLRIPENVLFDQGQAQVKEDGIQSVRTLSRVLYDVLQEEDYLNSVETIFIEGHTDNVPIQNDAFPSNWELSTQRAINTWNLMRTFQNQLDSFKNPNEQPIFSCSGYADTRPITDDDLDEYSDEGRQANRRIDLRFTMMPPNDPSKS